MLTLNPVNRHLLNIVSLLALLMTSVLSAQNRTAQPFRHNSGQWDERVEYRADLPGGYMFLEKNAFTYTFYDAALIGSLHARDSRDATGKMPDKLKMHTYKMHFEGAHTAPVMEHKRQSSDYANYFLGNDRSKWATSVYAYGHVKYNQLYNDIDLAIYEQNGHLKYDFIVAPGGNPKDIRVRYEGVDKLYLNRGNLIIETSLNEVIENQPIAFQHINGETVAVKCKFKLKKDVLTFTFPKGYNKDYPLIIDPVLIFGSYTGSSANNFGFTATYDDAGHLYGGGIVFSTGGSYPTTTGAYQVALTGGIIDMGITKFSPDGSSLIYSTYLGGSQNESPHSMVVNSNNELIIFGSTGSNNFPMAASAYDNTFGGGIGLASMNGYGYDHSMGTDMILAKLSFDGTNLLGTSYMGGSNNDGLILVDSLDFNYGDSFRGEVVVDDNDNIYVASTTASTDFPLANPTQPLFGGGLRDACAFKFNPDLSTLLWSTYIGGNQEDAAYGVQLSSTGEVLISGGTQSANFPIPGTGVNPNYLGNTDGYVIRYNTAGTAITGGTFLGTANHDQSYFVQLDDDDNVYVVGQSLGNYPVSTTLSIPLYTNANSHQFLHKFNPGLTATIWSTTLGSGQFKIDFSICAFLVNQCDHIYVSGWGGTTNMVSRGFMLPPASNTNGLPTTSGAFQPTSPNGSDFYLMVLDEDAEQLLYATYYGGTSSAEHVDGGTSRFDKTGKVYQAVCAGCGGFDDFPSTAGAWSSINGSSCNLGVFKFDLAQLTSDIQVSIPYICIPGDVTFVNNSNGGTDFVWDFGDGSPIYTTNSLSPITHTYTDTGNFVVTLIASDSLSCSLTDTAFINLAAYAPDNANILPADTICPGDQVQLFGSGGVTYQWLPQNLFNDPTVPNPIATLDTTTFITLLTTDSCGTDTAIIQVNVYSDQITAGPDKVICILDSTQLQASGGVSYSWSPTTGLSDPNDPAAWASPTTTTEYVCEIITANGCVRYDSMFVIVNTDLPVPVISPDATICQGESVGLTASGADTYSWSPPAGLNTHTGSSVIASPDQSITYVVAFTNGCGTVYDSVNVTVNIPQLEVSPDVYVCPGDTGEVWASGGTNYVWTPSGTLFTPDSSHSLAVPPMNMTYDVVMTDANGCVDSGSVNVYLFDLPFVNAGEDQIIMWGSSTNLAGSGVGTYDWQTTDETISCLDCPEPGVTPNVTTEYILSLTDSNGCTNTDTVMVIVDGALYIPNSFSPNGDEVNDIFYAYGAEIAEFELLIFNRWGQLIFRSESLDHGWDGTFKGKDAQIDTYVWKVKYTEKAGKIGEAIGHVTLVR